MRLEIPNIQGWVSLYSNGFELNVSNIITYLNKEECGKMDAEGDYN